MIFHCPHGFFFFFNFLLLFHSSLLQTSAKTSKYTNKPQTPNLGWINVYKNYLWRWWCRSPVVLVLLFLELGSSNALDVRHGHPTCFGRRNEVMRVAFRWKTWRASWWPTVLPPLFPKNQQLSEDTQCGPPTALHEYSIKLSPCVTYTRDTAWVREQNETVLLNP